MKGNLLVLNLRVCHQCIEKTVLSGSCPAGSLLAGRPRFDLARASIVLFFLKEHCASDHTALAGMSLEPVPLSCLSRLAEPCRSDRH